MNKNQKLLVIAVVTIVVILVGWNVFRRQQTSVGTIKIGVLAPLTGNFAVLGERIKNGMDLAREDILKTGSVKSIDITYEDACLPKDTVSAVQKLIQLDNIHIIGGSFCLIGLVPVLPTTEVNKMIVFNTAANPDSVLNKRYVFSTFPSIKQNSQQLSDYAIKTLNAKTAAIVYYNTPFGLDYSRYTPQSFEASGGKIVDSEMTALDTTDYRTQLAKIKTLNPDAIFVVELANPLGNFLKQVRQLGLKSAVISNGEAEDPTVVSAAGMGAEGFIVSSYEPKEISDNIKSFQMAYKNKYGIEPDAIAANAYDGLKLQIVAYKKCNGDPDCMADELHKIKNYSGVSGVITINADGSAFKPVIFKVVKGGQFIPIK